MNYLRRVAIIIINFLPKNLKWKLFSFSFFGKRLRIDFLTTRSTLLSKSSIIIVIGANDGLSFDNLFQSLEPQKVSGLVIEPSTKYFDSLKKNLKDFKNIQFLKQAISSKNEQLKLFQLNDSGLNKMPDWGKGIGSFRKDHLLQYHQLNESDIEFEHVNGITFKTLLEKYLLSEIDYLQIDTEGFDAEIIKMIDFNLFYPRMIKFEIANLRVNEILDVINILKNYKFIPLKLKGDMIAYSQAVNPFFY